MNIISLGEDSPVIWQGSSESVCCGFINIYLSIFLPLFLVLFLVLCVCWLLVFVQVTVKPNMDERTKHYTSLSYLTIYYIQKAGVNYLQKIVKWRCLREGRNIYCSSFQRIQTPNRAYNTILVHVHTEISIFKIQ